MLNIFDSNNLSNHDCFGDVDPFFVTSLAPELCRDLCELADTLTGLILGSLGFFLGVEVHGEVLVWCAAKVTECNLSVNFSNLLPDLFSDLFLFEVSVFSDFDSSDVSVFVSCVSVVSGLLGSLQSVEFLSRSS